MKKWTHQPEEQSGDYFFSGRALMTIGVSDTLEVSEIFQITSDIRRAVQENDGLDYLQVFQCDDGLIVWAIDQLSKSMKDGDDYTPEQVVEYDYWTMLLPEEY